MKAKKKGFTFMEVMITLMIIITLSLLSFPLYTKRVGDTKVKLAEGYALLGYIVNAQVSYFNEYGNFLGKSWISIDEGFTSNHPVLGVNAINNRYFRYFNEYAIRDTSVGGEFNYHFAAAVRTKDRQTILLEYNLTQRFEPVLKGITL